MEVCTITYMITFVDEFNKIIECVVTSSSVEKIPGH